MSMLKANGSSHRWAASSALLAVVLLVACNIVQAAPTRTTIPINSAGPYGGGPYGTGYDADHDNGPAMMQPSYPADHYDDQYDHPMHSLPMGAYGATGAGVGAPMGGPYSTQQQKQQQKASGQGSKLVHALKEDLKSGASKLKDQAEKLERSKFVQEARQWSKPKIDSLKKSANTRISQGLRKVNDAAEKYRQKSQQHNNQASELDYNPNYNTYDAGPMPMRFPQPVAPTNVNDHRRTDGHY